MEWIERHIGEEEAEGGYTGYRSRKRTRSEAYFPAYNDVIIEEEEQKGEDRANGPEA